MSVGFDPSTDFETITDGLEAVTLNRRGSSSNVSVTSALQRAVSTSEVAGSDGQYTQGDVRWHLPGAEVPSTAPPRIGDSIVDAAGDYWVILSQRLDTLTARWRCVTRNLAVQYGLDDTITIEVAAYTKGTGGAAEQGWSTWKTTRARIQEIRSDNGEREGARQTARIYEIYIATDYAVNHTHRVKDSKGTYYAVTGSSGVGEVGELQTVDATEWRQT